MNSMDRRIMEWRKAAARDICNDPVILDELEAHLRETVETYTARVMTPEEAFRLAAGDLGSSKAVAQEFEKVGGSRWLPIGVAHGFSLLAGAGVVALLAWTWATSPPTLGMAAHVAFLTLGYIGALLLGLLGACHLAQRPFAELSPGKLRSLHRVSKAYSAATVVLLLLGIMFGPGPMAYGPRAEWRLAGSLLLSLWTVAQLIVQHSTKAEARIESAMAATGMVITLASWFGAVSSGGSHEYGYDMPWLGLILTIFSAASVAAAVMPAGCLKRKPRPLARQAQAREPGPFSKA